MFNGTLWEQAVVKPQRKIHNLIYAFVFGGISTGFFALHKLFGRFVKRFEKVAFLVEGINSRNLPLASGHCHHSLKQTIVWFLLKTFSISV